MVYLLVATNPNELADHAITVVTKALISTAMQMTRNKDVISMAKSQLAPHAVIDVVLRSTRKIMPGINACDCSAW